MATVLEIVKSARRLLNIDAIGDSVPADECNEAMGKLRMILESWQLDQFILYHIIEDTYNVIGGQNSYTIGPGAMLDGVRPVKIDSMFTRSLGSATPIDYDCAPLTSREYHDIIIKNTKTSFPTHFYYDAGNEEQEELLRTDNESATAANQSKPSDLWGTIYLYPTPAMNLELHINRWMVIHSPAKLAETMVLPYGYSEALVYALAVRLAPMNGKTCQPGEQIYDTAAELRAALRTINRTPRIMKYDNELLRHRGFQIFRGW